MCYRDERGVLRSLNSYDPIYYGDLPQYYRDGNGNMQSWANRQIYDGQHYVMPNVCTVPLRTLMNDPYDLYSGEGVWATIVCRNKVGPSLPSDMGNDAKIPHPPGACLNLEVLARTANSIQIGWTEARDYDDILFYAPITRY